jgi:fatty aldehyde decarbonylase
MKEDVMEPAACFADTDCSAPLDEVTTPVWIDVLAQAVTGERIGAMNYETLAAMCGDVAEREEALEHAAREEAHARMFRVAGRELGADITANVDAPYWARIRAAFVDRAEAGDRIACFVVQEVMLESFAVASYGRIARVAPGLIGRTFAAIAEEEREHVAHAVALLRDEREKDAARFDATVRAMHDEVMTTLAEMVAREDPRGHCGLCRTACVKRSLVAAGLTTAELRGASLRQYMETLDAIGVPGDAVLGWVTRLPV